MKKVLRSLTYADPAEKDKAKANLGYARPDRLLNLSKAEDKVLNHVVDFYASNGEPPALQLVYDFFEQANASEETTLVEELTAENFYEGASFRTIFEGEVEEQAAQNLVSTCKDAIKIATQGIQEKGTLIKGTQEAVAHLFSAARPAPPNETGRLKASMTENKDALKELYEERKNNPQNTYGVLTGYGIFDQATAGIRKKQFYIHAGFGGHLKSTLMFNMIVNAAVDGGWNPLLFTSEMPAEDVQQLLIAIHSANPKFNGVGRPINAFRLLLGALRPEEESFYDEVKDDLLTNPNHGSIRVIDSSEFTTFGSVMQRTVREHVETEVDLLWVDYITRLPVDAKYRSIDINTARNETLADAKRFAMSFNNGEGLPVCTPFQVNREGYKKAKTNEGRMDKTALAQYNAAEKEADVITYIFYDTDEQATSEPKIGMMKSRWGRVPADPISVFIEPDSRRIFDLTAGMGPQTGYAPTAGGGEEEVEL